MSYRLGCILLAGGQSARFGGNKLVSVHPVSNKPLVAHSAQQLLELPSVTNSHATLAIHYLPQPVVVTGKWDLSVRDALAHEPVSLVTNSLWQEGIASSIREGVKFLLGSASPCLEASQANPSHILITLADLPRLTAHDLANLVAASCANPAHIVCSKWSDDGSDNSPFETKPKHTVPAIFPATAFKALLALTGDVGAKPVIKGYEKEGKVTAVSIPNAQFDIDTPQDWTPLAD
ncbi:nucleotidyltransferase family protein [Alteromonas sp. 009811495]|uniref:nucleotidyltransferase family protein n=1 Tax=Alteromonas sp. 009811495 TaxID=3002962 RepID=UPI00237EB4C6|nr:nucleotidyltransferase family protein [Alteromonas sp. 009811495]WDT87896.1 nucleotidyltransferase family protein [Alteromonas sp. 009811495]